MKQISMLLIALSVIGVAGDFEDGVVAADNKNYVKAAKLWQKEADKGNVAAQYNLGIMYASGRGVKQNKSKAKEFFGKACDKKYVDGCMYYGTLKQEGF